jgi:hypothetical protein
MERPFRSVAPRRPRWNARRCRWTMRIVCLHWTRSTRSVDKVEKSLSQCVAPWNSPGRREIGMLWTCLKRLRLHISTLPDISFERRFTKVRNPTCRVDNVSSSVQSAAFHRSPLPPRWVPASEILVTPCSTTPKILPRNDSVDGFAQTAPRSSIATSLAGCDQCLLPREADMRL